MLPRPRAESSPVSHQRAGAAPQDQADSAGQCNMVTLTVRDNGVGMQQAANGQGLGVVGMRERIEALGGQFTIRNNAGGGITVSAVIPVPDATSAAV